jgi:hypothetical protein
MTRQNKQKQTNDKTKQTKTNKQTKHIRLTKWIINGKEPYL